jgi:hypothetical protein
MKGTLKIGVNSQGRLILAADVFKASLQSTWKRSLLSVRSWLNARSHKSDLPSPTIVESVINSNIKSLDTAELVMRTTGIKVGRSYLIKSYLSKKKDICLLQLYALLQENERRITGAVLEKTISTNMKTDWRFISFF